ncbi:hypothetical protein AKO1_011730, partial [Acrasis kona]
SPRTEPTPVKHHIEEQEQAEQRDRIQTLIDQFNEYTQPKFTLSLRDKLADLQRNARDIAITSKSPVLEFRDIKVVHKLIDWMIQHEIFDENDNDFDITPYFQSLLHPSFTKKSNAVNNEKYSTLGRYILDSKIKSILFKVSEGELSIPHEQDINSNTQNQSSSTSLSTINESQLPSIFIDQSPPKTKLRVLEQKYIERDLLEPPSLKKVCESINLSKLVLYDKEALKYNILAELSEMQQCDVERKQNEEQLYTLACADALRSIVGVLQLYRGVDVCDKFIESFILPVLFNTVKSSVLTPPKVVHSELVLANTPKVRGVVDYVPLLEDYIRDEFNSLVTYRVVHGNAILQRNQEAKQVKEEQKKKRNPFYEPKKPDDEKEKDRPITVGLFINNEQMSTARGETYMMAKSVVAKEVYNDLVNSKHRRERLKLITVNTDYVQSVES